MIEVEHTLIQPQFGIFFINTHRCFRHILIVDNK